MISIGNARKPALIYFIFGLSWIIFSDRLASLWVGPERLGSIQTAKGVLYVVVTTFLIYFLVKRQLRRLGESEQRHRELFENHYATSLLVDPESGTVIDANPAAAAWYGWSLQQLRGMNVRQLSALELSEVERQLERTRTLGRNHLRSRHRRADGSVREVEIYSGRVNVEGRPLLFSTIYDVTEQRRAEIELEASRQRMGTLLNSAPLAIWTLDPEGRVLTWNPAAEKIFGWSAEEAIGRLLPIVPEEKQGEFTAHVRSVVESGEPLVGVEALRRNKAGARVTVRIWAAPVRGADGEVECIMSVVDDISERLLLEAQLNQARKMEAVGQLAGGVAHDFNNLLQVINGQAFLAQQQLPETHPARELLGEIVAAGERAAALTRQLLAFSRRQIMQAELLDLNAVIEDLLRILRRVIGEHIRLAFIPGHPLGSVRADRGMLEQVLMNLCINARDAMDRGGEVTIETESVQVGPELLARHPLMKPGPHAMMSVTDTGCGMEAETISHIFEPFFTTKGAGQGTGLGLATVYGVVKQHDGIVTVTSEPGVGTTFRIYLPLAEQCAAVVGAKTERPAPGGSETILLVEDDEAVRRLARSVLEKAGYEVITAGDGEEAIETYERHRDKVALLILDVVMPKLGGVEAYGQIRERWGEVPVLFSSGYTRNMAQTNIILQEGRELLQKPYAPASLLRAVRRNLDRPRGTSAAAVGEGDQQESGEQEAAGRAV